MLIDTGAPWMWVITPDIYKPSAESIALNKTHPKAYFLNQTHWDVFLQTKANGCGTVSTDRDAVEDIVSFHGLTAKNQRFGVAVDVRNSVDRATVLDSRK